MDAVSSDSLLEHWNRYSNLMKIEKFQWELWEWNADGVTVICCLEYAGNENKFCFVLCNSKKSLSMQNSLARNE